jgi:hypothetical protein
MQSVRKAISGGFEQRMAKGPDCFAPLPALLSVHPGRVLARTSGAILCHQIVPGAVRDQRELPLRCFSGISALLMLCLFSAATRGFKGVGRGAGAPVISRSVSGTENLVLAALQFFADTAR